MKIVKKNLTICTILILIPVIFFGYRYVNNTESVSPYPFKFQSDIYENQDINAPIVILGDSLSVRLATFKDLLSEKLSKNLSKKIKIQIMANEGDNIHRSLLKLKKLKKSPLVILYMGNTDNSYEKLYHSSDIPLISSNFKLYNNDYIKSALMLLPSLSRFIYKPVNKVQLTGNTLKDETKYSEVIKQKRDIINYQLYEAGMQEMVSFTKKRGSFLIPLTTPLNLNTIPHKSCSASMGNDAKEDLRKLKNLLKKKDYKAALNSSKDLALIYSSNAQVQYLHGLVSRKLNLREKAQKHLELSIAYDCGNHKGSPVYNAILKKVTSKHNIEYFDFHQFLVDQSYENYTFLDDIYPQDLYFEKTIDVLAHKLKVLLKL